MALISLKIKISGKIHTKSFEILCKKSVLLSCLVILSLRLKIITLKQPMSEMLWKITTFLVDLEFEKLHGFNKNQIRKTDKKSFFQHF